MRKGRLLVGPLAAQRFLYGRKRVAKTQGLSRRRHRQSPATSNAAGRVHRHLGRPSGALGTIARGRRMVYRRSHRRRARTCSRSRAARSLRAFSLAWSLRCAISLHTSSNATAAVDRPGPGSWVCFGITLNSSSLRWRTAHRKDVRARHPSGGTYVLDSTRRECSPAAAIRCVGSELIGRLAFVEPGSGIRPPDPRGHLVSAPNAVRTFRSSASS